MPPEEEMPVAATTTTTGAKDDGKLYETLRALPKVELHAHLNGCIREETLFALAQERGVELPQDYFTASPDLASSPFHPASHSYMYNTQPRSLTDCFALFAQLPRVINDLPALQRITREALQDFATHGVVYLELRSTPKRLLRNHRREETATKRDYVDTMLQVMQEFQHAEETRYQRESQQRNHDNIRLPMQCRFLISIDRSQSVQEAAENVDLAIDYHHRQQQPSSSAMPSVVGMDLGGNPTRNDFRMFVPQLQRARQAGLGITVHCAEIPCEGTALAEAQAVLDFRPDRIGHALLLPPPLQQVLKERRIPVETCPTSNVMTLELARHHDGSHLTLVEGLAQHQNLRDWLDAQHPLTIATDDPGLFGTDLTKEFWLVARTFGLDCAYVANMAVASMGFAFCSDETRTLVSSRLKARKTGTKQIKPVDTGTVVQAPTTALIEAFNSSLESAEELRIKEAIRQLSAAERFAYDRALESAPELVRQESPLSNFLRKEHGNEVLAVRRLCAYWKYRKSLFRERWLLHMSQNGKGCLNADDITMLRTGYFTAIQVSPGKSVVLFDISRLPCKIGEFNARIAFYMAFAYREYAQDITFIHVVTGKPSPLMNMDPTFWRIFKEALTITVTKIIVAQSFDPYKKALLEFMTYQTSRATEFKSGLEAIRIAGNSEKETLALLKEQGLTEDCLPRSLGGTFSYTIKLNDWIRTRLALEEAISPAVCCYRPTFVGRVTAMTTVARRGTLSTLIESRASTESDDVESMGEAGDSPKSIRRRRNAMYSRRSYQRRKLKIVSLEDEHRCLQYRNKRLKLDNRKLQEALEQCEQLVTEFHNRGARVVHTQGSANVPTFLWGFLLCCLCSFAAASSCDTVSGILRDVEHYRSESVSRGRPFISLCFAQSLDGKLALHNDLAPDETTSNLAISGGSSLMLTHALRSCHDGILVGGRTLLIDNPRLSNRLWSRNMKQPRPVVLDSQLQNFLKLGTRRKARNLIVCCSNTVELPENVADDVELLPCRSKEDGTIDIDDALYKLWDTYDLQSIMVEGGPKTLGLFLDAGLFDCACITVAPVIFGSGLGISLVRACPLDGKVSLHRFDKDMCLVSFPSR